MVARWRLRKRNRFRGFKAGIDSRIEPGSRIESRPSLGAAPSRPFAVCSFLRIYFYSRAMQRSSLQLMLIVLVVGLLLMRESRQNPGAMIENDYVDWLAANTTRNAIAAPLTLVEINDSSLADKHPWPWSP